MPLPRLKMAFYFIHAVRVHMSTYLIDEVIYRSTLAILQWSGTDLISATALFPNPGDRHVWQPSEGQYICQAK